MKIDNSRDELFSKMGKATLQDRYLLPNETYQGMFKRVATAFADNDDHAQRLYDYMSKHWFMPATPILANGGTTRGQVISCFLQSITDSMDDIIDNWRETAHLAAMGGGIGVYYGNVRPVGDSIGHEGGKTSGVIPFIKVNDSLSNAVSQGNLRRGSAAAYLPVWHAEIEEFVEVRKPTGGDSNRKSLNIHHGIVIDDKFMKAVESNGEYELTSSATGKVIKTIKARELWIKIITMRLETGEPYLLWVDRLKEAAPAHHKTMGLEPVQSNLCSEITLPTNKERTAVCCLSSLNIEYWDAWKNDEKFIDDVMRFLDNVLQSFIDTAPPHMAKAINSAKNERSVGLGAMGFHSYLQSKNIPIDCAIAKSQNNMIFKHIKKAVDESNVSLAKEKGACPDACKNGDKLRFSYTMAIAPNASISTITGSTSPGIEPFNSNVYSHKTLSGTFTIKNKHLRKLIADKYPDQEDEVWSDIISSEGGSIQSLKWFTKEEKEVFKTAFELDQRWLIEHAADRQPYIDQAQSLNIFLPANAEKSLLHKLHMEAWRKGLKSMYYLRSLSSQRAERLKIMSSNEDECLSCN